MTQFQWKSDLIEVGDEADPIEVAYQNGWTDGLPVVPPTPERVERMLTGTSRPADEVIAPIPPKWGRATVEKVAINAVMSGCKPEYMPVIIAAIEAMTTEAFSLHGIQVTTSLVSPLLIVNGPIRGKLEINDGFNVFGQGSRSNATIGRAGSPNLYQRRRRVAWRIGSCDVRTFWEVPRIALVKRRRSALGFRFTLIENLPRHKARLPFFAGAAPQVIDDHSSNTAEGILNTICQNLAVPGIAAGEILLVLSPEHSKTIGDDGLTKREVQEYVHEYTKIDTTKNGRISPSPT